MENAKKNLVFHFGVGRQASFLKIGYVKHGAWFFYSIETFWETKILFLLFILFWKQVYWEEKYLVS